MPGPSVRAVKLTSVLSPKLPVFPPCAIFAHSSRSNTGRLHPDHHFTPTFHIRQSSHRPAHTLCSRRSISSAPELPLSDAQRQTIYAVATPPGKGGVAIVRISGPQEREGRRCTHDGRKLPMPEPRKMVHCWLVDPVTQEVLDDGLAVFFKSPRSFTTEDVLELHVHSGRAVVSAVLSALARLPGLRPAERGEFTRRAFTGGRMDLTQVEGLRDLINAETAEQRRVALGVVRGSAKRRFEDIRKEIVQCMAMIEALIDFGEGEDIEEGVYDSARERVMKLYDLISSHLSDKRRGEILRSGVKLTIFGPPNVGKSSLLNLLAQRDAAIVTPVPGTTRDVLELTIDMGGLAVVVSDTAGLRKAEDLVEQIGISRAQERIHVADVSICVLSLPEIISQASGEHVPRAVSTFVTPSTFVLLNKSDLCTPADIIAAKRVTPRCSKMWVTSLSTGCGVDDFLNEFGDALRVRYDLSDCVAEPLVTNARHRAHLQSAYRFLEAFLKTPKEDVVLAAEELRYAADAVGKVTGMIGVEEVLDSVFREFCIGK